MDEAGDKRDWLEGIGAADALGPYRRGDEGCWF